MLGFFWTNLILKKFDDVRPSWLTTFHAPFNHLNMSLKSARIHLVNVCFLGDWPVLQFLGERLRGEVGRQCYFLLSGLILCGFLLPALSKCYFFQSDDNINLTFLPVFRMVVMEIFSSQKSLGSHKCLPQLFLFITNECSARFLKYLDIFFNFLIFHIYYMWALC